MAKTLTVFFSRAGENYFVGAMRTVSVGNTERVVRAISELIETDTFRIEMQQPYAEAYMTCIEQAKRDKASGARPALCRVPDSIDAYDTVILAYPNYWGTAPMAVFTFLDGFDFAGKTIYPLCTHEGSGLGVSERDIQKACPGAKSGSGLAIMGSRADGAKPQVEAWLKQIGLL